MSNDYNIHTPTMGGKIGMRLLLEFSGVIIGRKLASKVRTGTYGSLPKETSCRQEDVSHPQEICPPNRKLIQFVVNPKLVLPITESITMVYTRLALELSF